MARVDGSSQPKSYRKNGRPWPLNAVTWSGVIVAMTTTNGFLPSCWFWFARRARRRATGRSDSAGRAVRDQSEAEIASRGRNEQREAQRPQGREVSGAGTGAPHAATVGDGDAQPIERSGTGGVRAGVLAGRVWSVTARLSKRSRAARSLASARPCGPGRARRSGGEGARAAGRPTGAGSPTRRARHQAQATAVVIAAVEASLAPCRAQRRAGANLGGRRRAVTQRSEVEGRRRRRGLAERRVPRGILAAHAVRPARPHSPDGAQAQEEAGCVSAIAGAQRAAWFCVVVRERTRAAHLQPSNAVFTASSCSASDQTRGCDCPASD